MRTRRDRKKLQNTEEKPAKSWQRQLAVLRAPASEKASGTRLFAERRRNLYLQIAQRRRFDRKRDDSFAGRFFGQAVQKAVLRPADNVQFIISQHR